MSEENDHWSSPNGCHPDCPVCEFERDKLRMDRVESLKIILDLAAQNVVTEQMIEEDFNIVEVSKRQNHAIEVVDQLIYDLENTHSYG